CPCAGLLRVLRAQTPGGDRHYVIVELRPQTDGVDVVVIHAALRLMPVAKIESFRLSKRGISRPDAVSASASWPGLRIGQHRYERCDGQFPSHLRLPTPLQSRNVRG